MYDNFLNSTFWIGLEGVTGGDDQAEGWYWMNDINDEGLNYTDLPWNEVGITITSGCGYLKQVGNSYQVSSADCSLNHANLCEFEQSFDGDIHVPHISVEVTGIDECEIHENEFGLTAPDRSGVVCYSLILEALTFDDSRAYCNDVGGRLAIFRGLADVASVWDNFGWAYEYAWIGILGNNDSYPMETGYWVDDTRMEGIPINDSWMSFEDDHNFHGYMTEEDPDSGIYPTYVEYDNPLLCEFDRLSLEASSTQENSQSDDTGMIVGAVTGSFFVLALLGGIGYLAYKKYSYKLHPPTSTPETIEF